MSRTSETTNANIQCKNAECGKTLAKSDEKGYGIKCRCGTITRLPDHFYPHGAISGTCSLETEWEKHRQEAAMKGCEICGITPAGSHALAAQYITVPPTLDTKGTDYVLPQFEIPNSKLLAGARVLVVSADGSELPEIDVPIKYLRSLGAAVELAGQDWIFQWRNPAGHIVISEWLSDNICVKADLRLSDVQLEHFDAVYIPGGAWNPDMLRTDDVALRLIREAHSQGLLLVSLCHGPQVLINAAFDAPEDQTNFPSVGTHITGTGSIRRDLKNAGFIVHTEEATVYDRNANLLTARDPNDLGALCEKFAELLKLRLDLAVIDA